jgi:hypothetical protein
MCGFRRQWREELLASIWTSGPTECSAAGQSRHFDRVAVTSGLSMSEHRQPRGANSARRANQFSPLFPAVQPPLQKYFCFSEIQIKLYDLPSHPERGALRNVINVGRGCGGRGWRL